MMELIGFTMCIIMFFIVLFTNPILALAIIALVYILEYT